MVDLIRSDFPSVRIFVRSYDRIHSLALREKGIEYELRETLESGLMFGRKALEALDIEPQTALEIADDIRERDEERLQLQAVEGLAAGRQMLHNKPVRPEPLMKPKNKDERCTDMEEETEVSL